ncbi:zinc-ribbon domain-containing protein [Microbacterium koreense]|uniref:Zinc-ribbon domain-containing protein n=1 Tax=Microbacterium koreense TaxID=323761 RepID=A0ABW2ZU91_9MICO
MAERVQAWWARRQFSRGRDVPYDVGAYREAWASYPQLVRQYHPDLNAGIVLSQIPPAADVLLLWQCEAGHLFVATPTEQRSRPGGVRRRSAWCPECSELAQPRRVGGAGGLAASVVESRASRPPSKRSRRLCDKTPSGLVVGDPFRSVCAPDSTSAAEGRLRAALAAQLRGLTVDVNAVRVGRAFFDHLEVWPDIVLPELRVAIEYDTTGRHGLEHVGPREETDRRKDRLLREAGWEVVRLRAGGLVPLGPHDLQVGSVGARTVTRLIETLRGIRGALFVDAYRA